MAIGTLRDGAVISDHDARRLLIKQIGCLIVAVFFALGGSFQFSDLYIKWNAYNSSEPIVASVIQVDHLTHKFNRTKITYVFYTMEGYKKQGDHTIYDVIKHNDVKVGDEINLYIGSNRHAYYIDNKSELYLDAILYALMFAISILMIFEFSEQRKIYLKLKG